MRSVFLCAALAIAGCDHSDACSMPADCKPAPGSAHYCEHYTCGPQGACVYSFVDGDPVACGNTDCWSDGDCEPSTDTIAISCVSGRCVGSVVDAGTMNPALSLCEMATQQLSACGIGGSPSPSSCAIDDCKAACVVAASCADLVDAFNGLPSAANPFLSCWSAC